MRTLYCSSYCSVCQWHCARWRAAGPDLLQRRSHYLGPVVDGKDDVGDARCGQAFDLVQDHGLVAKLDQRLRQGKGLWFWSIACP